VSAADALLPVATQREAWRTVGTFLRPQRPRGIAALLVLLAGSAAGLAAPLLLGAIVDVVADERGSAAVTAPVLGLVAAAVAEAILAAAGMVLVAQVGQTVLAGLREVVVERALALPTARVERSGTGDLVARVGDDVAVVSEAVTDGLPGLVRAVFTIALTFVGLAALDWRLALAGAACVPVQVWAVRYYRRNAEAIYAAERRAGSGRAEQLLEAVGGAPTVRAFGLAGEQVDRVADRSWTAATAAVRSLRFSTGFFSRLNGAEWVGTSAVLIAGFLLVDAGSVSIGAATAAALFFVRLFDPVMGVIGAIDEAQRAAAGLARLVGVTQLPPAPAAPRSAAAKGAGGIAVRGVSFAYEDGHEVLHGVDLDVAPGERLALVGVSGAGKSTLAKLVAGLHAPTTGTAEVGGRVVLVTQEVHVFAGPLAEDLRLAAPDATAAQLRAALDRVGALPWVQALPDGLDTVVGDGGHRLTAAQAQQVALARVALIDPAVAVLDEATAEAGSAGARVLEQAADRVLEGRTAVVVAHRLTQAARADRIAVLDAGRMAELGTHAELVARGGIYAELWGAWAASRRRAARPPA
jgi:ATP-binding cassette subfamily C protein